MTARVEPKSTERDLIAQIRRAARQEQFLEVVSAEEAHARFMRRIDLSPLAGETVGLSAALGRVLARDVTAPIDVPPFDRAAAKLKPSVETLPQPRKPRGMSVSKTVLSWSRVLPDSCVTCSDGLGTRGDRRPCESRSSPQPLAARPAWEV